MLAAANVAGVNFPGLLQAFHIVGRDLGGGGIFLCLLIAAERIPDLRRITVRSLGGGAMARQKEYGSRGGGKAQRGKA